MYRVCTVLFLFFLSVVCHAQIVQPAHFDSRLDVLSDGTAEIVFEGSIDKGWHVYSTDLGDAGPISASLIVNSLSGVDLLGTLQPRGKEIMKFDKMFGAELRFFEDNASFVQKIKFVGGAYSIDCALEYGACDNTNCVPPSYVILVKNGDYVFPTKKENSEGLVVAKESENQAAEPPTADVLELPDEWTPVVDAMREFDANAADADMPWWQIFLEGLIGGLLALFTPCVWPIIPLTVSFFLKKSDDQRRAVADAFVYGLAIMVIYVGIGLLVTLLLGANALNAMATNAFFNVFFFLLLLLFAASFFGAFDITLPTSWSDRIEERRGRTSGLPAIFLLAFMLALVSFSCTGPIIGVLLVAVSTQGSIISPTIGMLGFAVALALPFTLFALFPTLLKSAPKSGGWMNAIKVTLGFVELAFALKFLSVADMTYGWHILDREVFISLWIIIFFLLGVYHLGWLKFSHDVDEYRTNVPQFFIALISLSFAIYMVPGLWGAPLKAVSAFMPPLGTQDFIVNRSEIEADYYDFDRALLAAAEENKLLLVDFTGFGCVNCRKMEAAIWTDPQVARTIREKFILVSLYVDDRADLDVPMTVVENGEQKQLLTVGDKWSFLQRHKFGANTQPFYVVIDANGQPLSGSRSYNENVPEFLRFLNSASSNMSE